MTGRAPCVPGCTCKKHTPAPRGGCPEGCTCKRHDSSRRINWDDPDVVRAYKRTQQREKYARDSSSGRAAVRRWQMKNPYYVKYRMTTTDWVQLLDRQNGCCYLCRNPFNLNKPEKSIHVDHDHTCCPGHRSCGKCVRGLACRSCNQGIGWFKDDPERIRRAAKNLRAVQLRQQSPPD